jgi:hypothetical protein
LECECGERFEYEPDEYALHITRLVFAVLHRQDFTP